MNDSSAKRRPRGRWILLVIALGVVGLVAAVLHGRPSGPSTADQARAVPAPSVDAPAQPGGTETAVFAGGCFWGVQGVFQHVKGVTQAVSGYAGGQPDTAIYEEVGTGTTGHAEAVKITYDPAQVSYGQLLRIFFAVVHDPTQLDAQGPDRGPQYRSAIFAQNPDQQRIAEAYIAQLDQAKTFHTKIVTRMESGQFFPAEPYHQDYLTRNPSQPYIVAFDLPKLQDLQVVFPDMYRAQPALVNAG
jgi:peptide-methionine (S)-S-oxide reductase